MISIPAMFGVSFLILIGIVFLWGKFPSRKGGALSKALRSAGHVLLSAAAAGVVTGGFVLTEGILGTMPAITLCGAFFILAALLALWERLLRGQTSVLSRALQSVGVGLLSLALFYCVLASVYCALFVVGQNNVSFPIQYGSYEELTNRLENRFLLPLGWPERFDPELNLRRIEYEGDVVVKTNLIKAYSCVSYDYPDYFRIHGIMKNLFDVSTLGSVNLT